MLMIIGSETEAHAKHIADAVVARGSQCFYMDTMAFPTETSVGIYPGDTDENSCLTLEDGRQIALQSIRSVYWRYHFGIAVPEEIPPDVAGSVYREIDATFGSLWRSLPHARWVNSVEAIEMHRYKPYQLSLLAAQGIPLPDTLITNNPERIRMFYNKHQGEVIYKPVSGGAHTAKLLESDLTEERMADLRRCPVQFQEMIEGVDIRVYLIGDHLFAAEIQADSLDFRDDENAQIVPVTLPKEVEAQCRVLAQQFHYLFTGIDIRRTPDNRYIFIEGNPSPMFIHFEKQSGYPITDKLVDLLLHED